MEGFESHYFIYFFIALSPSSGFTSNSVLPSRFEQHLFGATFHRSVVCTPLCLPTQGQNGQQSFQRRPHIYRNIHIICYLPDKSTCLACFVSIGVIFRHVEYWIRHYLEYINFVTGAVCKQFSH